MHEVQDDDVVQLAHGLIHLLQDLVKVSAYSVFEQF